MSFKIALVGNPNCGKSTLFNILTKSRQKIGNWAGVTIEQKTAKFFKNKDIEIIDLPGLYSLHPFSPDEQISSDFFKRNKPDAIINVVSSLNIERSLYLTLQLLELNIPTVIAITMLDIFKKSGNKIHFDKFSEVLKCKVFPISKNNKNKIFELIEETATAAKSGKLNQNTPLYTHEIENCLNKVAKILTTSNTKHSRSQAIKILEQDEKKPLNLKLSESQKIKIKKSISLLSNKSEKKQNLQNLLVNERYKFINKNIKEIFEKNSINKISISDRIDSILLNKYMAIPAFIIIISVIYFISIPIIGKPISEWLDNTLLKSWLIPNTQKILTKLSIKSWLINLICHGIISGVGSVLIFIPQLFLLFSMLSFLEECGYMSRITFITDKILNKFGFCGQSIISFLVSSSCGANGILATKTIKNKTTRMITIITTTFIPCSAKIPIMASISSLFLTSSWLIAPITYMICIITIFVCGLFLKNKHNLNQKFNSFFMEMLPYQLPSLKHMITDTLSNIIAFVFKALTVVLIASILIWSAANLGFFNGKLCIVQAHQSILAKIGNLLTPVFKPLGFSNWQTISASISGLFAKENIVNTLEVITASNSTNANSIANLFQNQAAAFSFLIFNLLCAPCCIAITAVYKQTNSLKLTLKVAAFQTTIAWCFSTIVFFISRIII